VLTAAHLGVGPGNAEVCPCGARWRTSTAIGANSRLATPSTLYLCSRSCRCLRGSLTCVSRSLLPFLLRPSRLLRLKNPPRASADILRLLRLRVVAGGADAPLAVVTLVNPPHLRRPSPQPPPNLRRLLLEPLEFDLRAEAGEVGGVLGHRACLPFCPGVVGSHQLHTMVSYEHGARL
jgi:hypothetical protein